MNKKIKVIELLNRIHDDKDVPGIIQFNGTRYLYAKADKDYRIFNNITEKYRYFFDYIQDCCTDWLDVEVEILEDEKEEKIDIQAIKENKELAEWPPVGTYSVENLNAVARRTYGILKEIMYTQNDLIRSVKQLDKKINKEE